MKKDCIVILPKNDKDLYGDIKYTFGNVLIIDNDSNLDDIINEINKKRYKNIYLVNFDDIYRKLLLKFDKNANINAIITHPIASFTNIYNLNCFQNIMEFYDRGLYKCICTLEMSMYDLLKKKDYNTKQIMFDTNVKYNSDKVENSIGVMSKDYIPNHNFYNALSAAKKSGIKLVKIESSMCETKGFIDLFDINVKYCESEKEAYSNNIVNIYPIFTDAVFTKVIASFDSGIPCIIGNGDIFDNYKLLKEYCVLISDDDIEELSNKINEVVKNKEAILKEYKEFRKHYRK